MRTGSWTTRSGRRTPARSLALAMAALPALPAIGQATAAWLDPVDGNWTDPTRWSTNPYYPNNGLPAGSTYQAAIGAAGLAPYTVTLQNNVTIDGLTLNSTNATLLQVAGNLTLLGTLDLKAGTYQFNGGQITGGRIQAEDGQLTLKNLTVFNNVTLAAPVTVTWSNPVFVEGELTLDGGSVNLMSRSSNNEGATLTSQFSPIVITGTGAINFDASGFGYYSTISAYNGQQVTIGPGVSVNTRTGGGVLTGFLNQGAINVSASTVFVRGTWTNRGTINLSGGSLELGGSFSTSDMGTLVRTGGGLAITGTVNNVGQVLDLSHLGSIRIAGTINGGTITASGSTASLSLWGNSTFNGVTLDADLSLPDIYYLQQLTIANGLTLLNGHRITLTMGGSMDVTPISGNGQIVVDGVPNSAGYATAIHGTVSPNITLATGIPGNLNFTFDGVNQGTLLAQTPSVPLRLVSGWSNAGGVVEAVNGGAIELNSNPGSLGNFTVNGATLLITTGITTSQLGQIGATNATELIGGFIPSAGMLDNTGAVLAIGGNGNTFSLYGGQINGGTITAAVPGTHLHALGTPVYLPEGYAPTISTASNVTFSLPVDIDDRATLASIGKMTLDGIDVSLGGSSSLTLSTLSLTGGGTSAAMIAGQGSIVFNGAGTLNSVTATTALTLGPGITIRTGSGGGSVGSPSVPVINQGLISARTPGRTLTVSGSAYGLSNLGVMEAVNGGSLVLNGLTNTAAINASGTGSVTLGGSWGNAGTITLADTSRLILGGTFRAADLGTITRGTNSTIAFMGVMDNVGSYFALNASTGSWRSMGGEIQGGNVAISGGAQLLVDGALTFSKGVTLDSGSNGVSLSHPELGGSISIKDSLTLINSTLDLGRWAQLTVTGTNDAALLGTGEVRLSSATNGNSFVFVAATLPLTLGPGILIHGNGRVMVGTSAAGIVNQGTLSSDVTGGRLLIDGRVTNQGTIQTVNGGTLELATSRFVQTSGQLVSDGDLPTSGWGLMQISGGSVSVNGSLGVPGSGGTVVLGLASAGPLVPLNVGSINQNEVDIHNTGVLTVSVSSNRITSNVNRLTIDGNGLMDLGNKGLFVDNVATPEATVRQYLKNGYNANPATGIGDWNGRGGITSADAIASHNGAAPDFRVSIGYVNGAYAKDPLVGGSIPGQPTLATNRTLIRPALYGDLNVDGKVDDTDLAIFSGLGQYQQPTDKFGWLGGDLNYDGKVDDADLQIFSGAGNYNGPSYGASATMAAAATPKLASAAGATPTAASPGAAGDGKIDFEYDAATGHLAVRYDGDPTITAVAPLQAIRLSSAGGHFNAATFNGGIFTGITANNTTLNGTIIGAGSIPDGFDLGQVLPSGLSASDLVADLTLGWNVSGGGISIRPGDFTVVNGVPEPVAVELLGFAAIALHGRRRKRR